MKQSSDKLYVTLIYVMLALVTFVAFEQVRHNDFIDLDDVLYVTENAQVKGGITPESVIPAFTTVHPSGNWHPLTSLSHMLDCQLFGLNPAWHHVTSLLFHMANTLLLFWVLKRMTGAIWRSAFVAALFALHPLHVESVAWVAERKDVLSGFLWLLTMAAYIRYAQRPAVGRYLLVFLFLCLGLMAKPMLVTLPFVLLLLDYWPLCRFQSARQGHRENSSYCEGPAHPCAPTSAGRLFAEKIPLFILVVASSILTFLAQQSQRTVAPMEMLPAGLRIANALVSYVKYIIKMFYPNHLALFYPHLGYKFPIWQAIISLLALVGVSVFLVHTVRRHRYPAVGWLWFLGTLVPVIGLVQVGSQAMADRYTYLPSIGFFIIVVWGAAELFGKWRFPKIVVGVLAAAVLAMLLLCTRTQVRYWKNSVTLYEHALEVTGDNFAMHRNLANTFEVRGKLDEAIHHYQEALQIKPNDARPHASLGDVFQSQGRLEEARHHYLQALRIKPDFAEVHNNLAVIMLKQGKFDEAINHYQHALRIRPDDAHAHAGLGDVLHSKGRLDEAVSHYLQALQINPDFAEVHNNLGVVMLKQGQLDGAFSHFRQAVSSKPDFVDALNNLAWLMAAHPKKEFHNPAEAVRLAETACELTNYDRADLLDTLSVAYGAMGKFPDAIETAQKALKLAESAQQQQLVDEIQNHLELFEHGQPYCETTQSQNY